MEFMVEVIDGEVYIDGKFVKQLCWNNIDIGNAVTAWLDGECDEYDD